MPVIHSINYSRPTLNAPPSLPPPLPALLQLERLRLEHDALRRQHAADLAALSAAQGEVGPGKLLFTCFEGEVPEKYGWPTG